MSFRLVAPLLLAVWVASAAAQSTRARAHICLAPPSVQTASGTAADAMNTGRETFTSYLTGPSLEVAPLSARLESQARQKAKANNCPYLLFTTLKQVRRTSGDGFLGRVAASAAEDGAYAAGAPVSSAAGRAAVDATADAAGAAAANYGSTTKSKDELTFTSHLESADGKVLVDLTAKGSAHSDGEDLLTPLVEKAATAVAAAVAPAAN